MDMLRWFADWSTGGARGYRPLFEAMRGDVGWAIAVAVLACALVAGCVALAVQWRRQERELPPGLRRQAMCRLRRTMVLVSAGGVTIMPLAMVWPAWRLYALVLLGVTLVVWRRAWTGREVKLLCRGLGQRPKARQRIRTRDRERRFFLSALGHDLKNPLHALTLQAKVAESALTRGDADAARRALGLMGHCVREADHLLGNFLELGRLDTVRDAPVLTSFCAAELIERVVAEHEPYADQKGLPLRVEVPGPLPVTCDRNKLDRIVRNLLVNAIKFTNDGSVVITGGLEGRSLWVAVEDTGPGVPGDEQERLFDAFYQSKRAEGDAIPSGHGLGLAIAARLARQLGGDIELDSEPGRGSRFCVTLPRGDDADASIRPQHEPHDHPQPQHEAVEAPSHGDAPAPPDEPDASRQYERTRQLQSVAPDTGAPRRLGELRRPRKRPPRIVQGHAIGQQGGLA